MATLPRIINAVYPNFVDLAGGQANCMWSAADQSDAGDGPFGGLMSATQAMSNCGVFAVVQQVRGLHSATPASGSYPTVSDQAVMYVQSAQSSGQIVIPGPVNALFPSGNDRADLDNPLVVAWFSAASSVLGDSYGNPWTSLVEVRRRKIRITRT